MVGGKEAVNRRGCHTREAMTTERDRPIASESAPSAEQGLSADQLRTLQAVSADVAAAMEPAQLAQRLVGELHNRFGYELPSTYFLDPETGMLRLAAQIGYVNPIVEIPRGRGVAGRVLETGQSYLVRDVRLEPRFVQAPGTHVASEACVPILGEGGQVRGIINVETSRTPLGDGDISLLELLARLVAVSLRNAELLEAVHVELERREDARAEAEALAVLAASVAQTDDPSETLRIAVTSVPVIIRGATVCAVALPDETGVLRYRVYTGVSDDDIAAYAFRPGEGYSGRAFAEGRLQRSDDLLGDARSHKPELDARLGARAFLAAPLMAHGRTLGVLAAASTRPGSFTVRHERTLKAVALNVAMALDSAERRQQAKREAAQKTAILAQMADAVLVTDASGRIVLANPAAAEVFGVPLEELQGLAPRDQRWTVLDTTGEGVPIEERTIARALAGTPTTAEYRILRPDDTERWLWASSTSLRDEAGVVQGAIVVARDITARKASEQQAEYLARTEKLRALGQLASGVAHDLNQSLALVAGYADLARAELDRVDPSLPRVREALEVASRAAIDGGETVRRLLAFARGRPEGPTERISLAPLLHDVAQLTAPRWRDSAQSEGRSIALTVEVDEENGEELAIQGWESSFREALTNLVLNAVDALADGGEIRLRAHRAHTRVVVEVADTGVGMPPEVRARIFEPFFTTKGDRGTGLGLAQVFATVERLGGEVSLESAPGEGTTFRLVFPAAPAGAAPRQLREAPGGEIRILRVLVVDDEPSLARMAALMLGQHGHQVVAATSGEEAMQHLLEQSFDVVISDLGMGEGMSGWDLAREVQRQWPGTAFILATGWGAQIEQQESRKRGVSRVVAKPYRLADLAQALEAVMAEREEGAGQVDP